MADAANGRRPPQINWLQVVATLVPLGIFIITGTMVAYAKLETMSVQLSGLDRAIISTQLSLRGHEGLAAHHSAAIKLNELTVLNQERWKAVDRRLARIERSIKMVGRDGD